MKPMLCMISRLVVIVFLVHQWSVPVEGKVLWGNIDDGWYTAKVSYTNYKTSYKARYTLDVAVKNDRVTVISFPDGGSLHTGYNNSGYTYGGGTLFFERNYSGDIIAASTTVDIYNLDGATLAIRIRIE